MTASVPGDVLGAFGCDAPAVPLPGGEGRTFRSGRIVLRRENPGDDADARFNAGLLAALPPCDDFRIARPLRARDGDWLAPGSWSACEYIEGRAATRDDAPAIVRALEAFHAAISHVPCPPHLALRENPYQRADAAAFGERVPTGDAALDDVLAGLYALRRPADVPQQLIHGDANEDNILIAHGQPPAIIDLAAYWRPASFALAVSAFWLGPYRGDAGVLAHYEHTPHFDQMLLRALIRSLYAAHNLGSATTLPDYRAAIDVIRARLQ